MSPRRSPASTATLLSIVLFATAVAAGPARAAEDGGTRSIFAQGAGNRALAMGGAYVALSDDASALSWNPGGLGLVSRREVQIDHLSLYGLGMAESHASLVMPSWRWGTAAITFRHFGVDGIEGRDDRNIVTDGDLADDEFEIALGYGRRLADGWSLGGAVKLQRQSLAGLSASGLGLDLGLAVEPALALRRSSGWMDGLRLGFALRNVVEPGLRLDAETVHDPLSLRGGAAYRLPLDGERLVTLAVDVEHSQDMDPRVHAGAELRLHSLLALRGGYDARGLVAGAGIAWRDFRLDYAFENNDLGSLHRLGLSISFGATVDEARRAAFAAQERALQARLDEAFARRQAQRVNKLVAEAETATDEGRVDDALQSLAALATLDPGNERAARIETRCWIRKAAELEENEAFAPAALAYGRALESTPEDAEALAGMSRCREESARRAARSAEVQKRFAEALDAFTEGDLVTARARFASVREVDPNDQEATAMLRRCEDAIRVRVSDLLEQAERFLHGGLYDEAESALARARRLDTDAAGLARTQQAIEAARAAARRDDDRREAVARRDDEPVRETQKRPALTAEQRAEADDLYRRGMEAMEAGRTDDALRYWELVYSVDPDHQQVREYLKSEYLTRGMDAFAGGRLDAAVGYWEKAVEVDPTDAKAAGYLARAREQLNRTREILGTGR